MCTIMTFDYNSYKENQLEFEKQILDDAKYNDDGSVLVLLDKEGEVRELIKTFNVETLVRTLENSTFSRAFIHNRATTGGDVNIHNIHGWAYRNGVFVFHNGILYDKEALRFSVDSMLIGHHINQGGPEKALEYLKTEYFANVMILDTKNITYYVHRSGGGSLYTDGKGNFSTNIVGDINLPVAGQTYGSFFTVTGEAWKEIAIESPKKRQKRQQAQRKFYSHGWSYMMDDLDDDKTPVDGVGSRYKAPASKRKHSKTTSEQDLEDVYDYVTRQTRKAR